MPNKNRVQLIIIGINLTDLNSTSVVVDVTNVLPTREITEETVEKSRDQLFIEIAGYDPTWANMKLIDVFKTGELGLTVVFATAVPTDIKLMNKCKFVTLNNLKPSDIGDHNYALILKALQQRY
jgi:hypothetical protein